MWWTRWVFWGGEQNYNNINEQDNIFNPSPFWQNVDVDNIFWSRDGYSDGQYLDVEDHSDLEGSDKPMTLH